MSVSETNRNPDVDVTNLTAEDASITVVSSDEINADVITVNGTAVAVDGDAQPPETHGDAEHDGTVPSQSAVDAKIDDSEKGVANGVASLNSNTKVPSNQLPAISVTEVYVVNSKSDLTALNANQGDVGVVNDGSSTTSYILTTDDASNIDNWQEMNDTAPVKSVNDQVGDVNLTASDVNAEPSGAIDTHSNETQNVHGVGSSEVASLDDVASKAGNPHGNEAHDSEFAVNGDEQPPEAHGNASHLTNFAEDGDTQPPENHGNEAHNSEYVTASETASDPHGNGAHSKTFAVDGDAQPPETHGNAKHSASFIADGNGNARDIYVIANGASDPASADSGDLIFEKQ